MIEHLERQPFAAAFKRYLFDPFAMTRAGVEGADLTADDVASSYARPAAGERGGPTPFGTRPAIGADGLVNVSSGLRYYNAWAQAAGASFSWNGGSWGIQASIVPEPNSDVTVVVLTNGSNAGDGSLDIARRLLAGARRTP